MRVTNLFQASLAHLAQRLTFTPLFAIRATPGIDCRNMFHVPLRRFAHRCRFTIDDAGTGQLIFRRPGHPITT